MNELQLSEDGRAALFAAYVKAQAGMGAVFKDAANPAFKSKYASLAAVNDATIPAFNAQGLAIVQAPSFDGEMLSVETYVIHTDGGWLKSTLSVRPAKIDAQGIGSAVTYLRRYGLMAMAGVSPEDDDGNAASSVPGRFTTAPEKVTLSEAAHLEKVADEVGARKVDFLKAMGVLAFKDFPAGDYDKALAALERKRAASSFREPSADSVAGNAREMADA